MIFAKIVQKEQRFGRNKISKAHFFTSSYLKLLQINRKYFSSTFVLMRNLFLQHVAQTSDAPLMLEIERAEGCYLYDIKNKKYLDLISGIAVSNLGHNNAKVKDAIIAQVNKYMHVMVYGEFIESPQVKYAKWLSDQLPDNLDAVYFTNSGSEAVEGAIKLAKRFTGRTEVISFENSYHGSTMGALSAGNSEERKNAFRPLIPDNRILRYNNFEDLDFITERTACVLIEPVQAEAGVILPAENYLKALREKCNQKSVLLLFDECQTGFGRTGSLFNFQKIDIIPDVLLLGKAVGGGMPLGAFISARHIMQAFTNQPFLGHITTFGGHPVCCAAGLASSEQLIALELIQEVETKAQIFISKLQHPKIKAKRNSGLLLAIQFESAEFNLALNQKLMRAGILTDWFLFAPDCLRIAPPLTISISEINFACDTLLELLENQ